MTAVFTHELKTYFRSLTAYVFSAFLLVVTGFGAMIYNINAAVSNFEYVLEFCSIVLIVIIPILTMRVIAEERRQKTEQLLYALPISTTEVVVGKYLALLAVFAVPICVIAVYPLVFSRYGEVYLLTAYGSLFAYFLMGAAFIAIGVFISSLTENQSFAAGIGVAVMLLNYYSVTLSEYVSSTVYGALFAVAILVFLLAVVIKHITGSENLGFGIGLALYAVLLGLYFFSPDTLESLLPNLMKEISLFKQFEAFINGVFDLTSVVYFLSVIVFFLFLTVQSLEKRRYN